MTAIESQLMERLKKLPPSRLAEVVDFVEFLASREERAAAAQRLTDGLARLDALTCQRSLRMRSSRKFKPHGVTAVTDVHGKALDRCASFSIRTAGLGRDRGGLAAPVGGCGEGGGV